MRNGARLKMVLKMGQTKRLAASLVGASLMLAACAGSADPEFAGSRRDPAPVVSSVVLPDASAGDTDFNMQASDGNVLLVYFGYTGCPDVCPTTLADISGAVANLGDDGEHIELAMATIDPERDTDEVLTSYVQSFLPTAVALRTEDNEQLQAAADVFGVYYEVTTSDDGDIEVLHTGTLFGVDDTGTLVASWAFGTPVSDLTNDLSILLGAT